MNPRYPVGSSVSKNIRHDPTTGARCHVDAVPVNDIGVVLATGADAGARTELCL